MWWGENHSNRRELFALLDGGPTCQDEKPRTCDVSCSKMPPNFEFIVPGILPEEEFARRVYRDLKLELQ